MSIDVRLANLNRKGRQPGAKNKSTVAREALASAAIVLLAEKLTPEELAELTPLHVLLSVMAARFKAGDLLAAASVATAAAPYVHARKSPNPTDPVIPPELQPDPDATPDEPGPPGGIID